MLVSPQEHKFEQLSTHKKTFTRAKETRQELTAPECNAEIRKTALKRVGRRVLYYPHNPFPNPSQHSVERDPLLGERGKRAPDFVHPSKTNTGPIPVNPVPPWRETLGQYPQTAPPDLPQC